jgi:CPA2 family monovalent cation:H+ antiporter-2
VVAVLLFKKIKQTLVLGHLIAGFLGNHFDFFHQLKTLSVSMGRNWCHLYQLFSLGLEFSFKKLMKVGVVPLYYACHPDYRYGIDGFLCGHMDGWKQMDLFS